MTDRPITKPRIDAWDAPLSDEQRWEAYAKFRRWPWYDVAKWIREQLGITPPSRSSLYRWADRMRKLESTRRLEEAILARDEIGALAGEAARDDKIIQGYKALGLQLALQGDRQEAVRLTQMAQSLAAQQVAQMELQLKAQRLEQQAAAQKLAREKFEAAEGRLSAVRDAVATAKSKGKGGLTAEDLAKIEEAAGLL